MKIPLLLSAASLIALLTALVATVQQHGEARDLRQEIATLVNTLAAPSSPPMVAAPAVPAEESLSEPEQLELLRLRGQVTQLRGEARGLEAAQQENASLKQRLAAAQANPTAVQVTLPPGYILRRTARNAGQATVEATVETFLWALEHREMNTLLQTLMPEDARKLKEMLPRQGEDFWQGAAMLPGMRVSDQKPLPDGSMELKLSIELEGTADQKTTKARQVDGLWRIEMR